MRYLIFREFAAQCREIQAPRRSRSDEWCTTDVHIGNGLDAIAPRVKVVDAVVVRQKSLVDDLDDLRVVRVKPYGAKVLASHPGLPTVVPL